MKQKEDELDRQENERDNRINIIGQNGNDGLHYTTLSDIFPAAMSTKTYKLNVNNIHDIEDIKDVLEGMGMHISIYGEPSEIQQRFIDKGLLEQ